jgi:hypothetical protein
VFGAAPNTPSSVLLTGEFGVALLQHNIGEEFGGEFGVGVLLTP